MTKTKAMMFAEIKTVIEGTELSNKAELIEFIDKQIAQLTNKSENRKPTKTQLENEEYKAEILEILRRAGKPMTIGEIKAESETFTAWDGSQRMSALLRQLGADGTKQVDKYTEKRVTYFKLAETAE